jgi:hypothetical protein
MHNTGGDDGGTTMDNALSSLTYHDHVTIHEVGHNACHDGARKYYHTTTAKCSYHHEPMNKMIKETSETLSNRLQYTQINYHIPTSYSILAS